MPWRQRGIVNPYILGGGGGGGPTVLWNPSDFNAAFTLSGGNKVAVRFGSDGWVSGRADHSFSSGKLYFGVLIGGSGSDAGLMVGLSDGSMSLNSFCGNDGLGFGYNSNVGDKYNGSNTSYGSAWGGGDHIGVAWDVGPGYIWFAKNNVWQASGDPASGSAPAFTLGAGSNLFPTISGYFGAGAHNFTLQANATDSTYSPPAGFSMVGV